MMGNGLARVGLILFVTMMMLLIALILAGLNQRFGWWTS